MSTEPTPWFLESLRDTKPKKCCAKVPEAVGTRGLSSAREENGSSKLGKDDGFVSLLWMEGMKNSAEFQTPWAANPTGNAACGDEVWLVWNCVGWDPSVWGIGEGEESLCSGRGQESAGIIQLIKVSINTLFD